MINYGSQYLVAYIVSKHKKLAEKTVQDFIVILRQQLQQQLAEYMIPSLFMVIDELPLNANGKVDKAVLPIPNIMIIVMLSIILLRAIC